MTAVTTKPLSEVPGAGTLNDDDDVLIGRGNVLYRSVITDLVDKITALFQISIDLFNDVDTSTHAPTTGQILAWDGTNWVPTNQTTALTVKDEGITVVSAAGTLNFAGAGVTATNSSGVAVITIPGPDLFNGAVPMPAFMGTLVKKGADETAADYTSLTNLTWDSEVYDSNGFHSTSTNTSRITIPASLGITKSRFRLGVDVFNVNNGLVYRANILKNGGALGIGGSLTGVTSDNRIAIEYTTPPIDCIDGDYFEAQLQVLGDTSITINDTSFFCAEVVEVTGGVNTLAVPSDKTIDFTFDLSQCGALVHVNKTTNVNGTIPPNTTVAFPIGTRIRVGRKGVGTFTFVAGAGVTIHASAGKILSVRYQHADLIKVGTDTWELAFFYATYPLNRALLGENDVLDFDLSDTQQYQTAISPFTSATSVVNISDELAVTWTSANIGVFTVWTQETIAPNRSFAFEATFDTIDAVLGGICIGETATAPDPGASQTTLPADFEMITARMVGALEARKYDTATAAVRLSVAGGGFAYPFSAGQRVRLSLTLDSTGQSGIMSVGTDGQELYHSDVSGFTVGHFVGFCMRFSANAQGGRYQLIERDDPTFNVTKSIYIDPDASDGGTGAESSPFNVLSQATRRILADSHGRKWKMILRNGTHIGTIDLPTDKALELEICSYIGERAIIKPSETLTSGWTSMAGDGYPHLWRRLHKFGGTSGVAAASLGAGSVIQTGGVTSTIGLHNTVTLPYRHLNRATVNVAIATMQTDAYEGSYTMYSSGTYAGQLVIHPYGNVDPNTQTYERQLFDAGIALRLRDDDKPNVCLLTVRSIDIQYPYICGMLLQRCYIDLFDTTIDGVAAGEGLQAQFCIGKIDRLDVRGTMSDNFNMGGAVDFDLDRKLHISVTNSAFHGATKVIWNGTPSDVVVGDNVSNHAGTSVYFGNCLMEAAAKYGGAMLDDCEFDNCTVQDCVGYGLSLSPQSPSGRQVSMRVRGGTFRNNLAGIVAEGVGTDTVATVIVEGNPFLSGNTIDHFHTFTLTGGAATITVHDWTTDLTIPSSGRTHTGGGTITAPAPFIVGAPMLIGNSATIGDGSSLQYTVTHNLGTRDVLVTVYDLSTYATVDVDVTRPTTSTVVLDFGIAPSTNAYRVNVAAITG